MPRRLRVPDPPVTALFYAARASSKSGCAAYKSGRALVLAHGAGAPQTHPFLVRYAKGLCARGIDVLTFNFPYSERGGKRPDPPATLEASWLAMIALARNEFAERALFIGGKSMGGRIASQVAARDDVGELGGLVFLGYPLHPPGEPKKLRAEHLARVRAPMLFVQGERDPFGTPAEIGRATRGLAEKPALYVVPDGDHSFAVRKSLGIPQERIHEDALDAIDAFMRAPLRPSPRASPSSPASRRGARKSPDRRSS
jgi:predicted alpha/beta-hydrolase family hydrolase